MSDASNHLDKCTIPEIPPAFRGLLLDFMLAFLYEQPDDIVLFGFNYFTKLKIRYSNSLRDCQTAEDVKEKVYSKHDGRLKVIRKKSVSLDTNLEDECYNCRSRVFPKTEAQKKRLEQIVKYVSIFGTLNQEQLEQVLDAMFLKKVAPGEIIIKQGDVGDYFYVIESGFFNTFVEVDGESKLVHTYDNKGGFGELALMYGTPRAATVKAVTDGSLWLLDRATFRKFILKSAFKKRKMYEKLTHRVQILSYLNSYDKMNLADALEMRQYENGETIISEGDDPDGIFFIDCGTVVVKRRSQDGTEQEINRITEGGYFGEKALLTHNKRAATVYAQGQVRAAFLNADAFDKLLNPCKEVMMRNMAKYESSEV